MIKLTEKEQQMVVRQVYKVADLLIDPHTLEEILDDLAFRNRLFKLFPTSNAWEVFLEAFWQLVSVFAAPCADIPFVDIEVGNGDAITFFIR